VLQHVIIGTQTWYQEYWSQRPVNVFWGIRAGAFW